MDTLIYHATNSRQSINIKFYFTVTHIGRRLLHYFIFHPHTCLEKSAGIAKGNNIGGKIYLPNNAKFPVV